VSRASPPGRSEIETVKRAIQTSGESPRLALLLGAAENLYGISDRFESTTLGEAVVYRKL